MPGAVTLIGRSHNVSTLGDTTLPALPAGAQVGDLVLVFITHSQARTVITTSADYNAYTWLENGYYWANTIACAWRIYDGVEKRSVYVGSAGSTTESYNSTIYVFRNHDPTTPIFGYASMKTLDNSDTTPKTAPSLNCPKAGSLVVVHAAHRNQGPGYSAMSAPINYTEDVYETSKYNNEGGAIKTNLPVGPTPTQVFGATATSEPRDASAVGIRSANNPPSQPGVFTSPSQDSIVSASLNVAWGVSTDAEGDPITYRLELSNDNGATWGALATTATTSWTFDVSSRPYGVYQLRVRAEDTIDASAWRTSGSFTIFNGGAIRRLKSLKR